MKTKLTAFWTALIAVILFSTQVYSQVTQEWVQRYNGSGNGADGMTDMFVDNSGNTYICGYGFRSETNTNDAVVIKYNSAGVFQWGSAYNGVTNGADGAEALAVDNSGNVYIVGKSQGSSSGMDIITIKFNSTGQQIWERRIDGAAHQNDYGRAIEIDAAGNICVAGDADVGLFNGSSNIVIAKYDPNGNLSFPIVNYNFSGDAIDIAYALTTDASNNIYVTGTWGAASGAVINSQITTLSVNASGTLRWVKQYGDPLGLPIEAYDIKIDGAGAVLIAGKVQSTATGQYQAAIVKYNSSNGNEIWSKRFTNSGSQEDIAARLYLDDSNNVYVTGYTYGTTSRDLLLVKYNAAGTLSWVSTYNYSPTNSSDEGKDIIIKGRWIYVGGWVTGPLQKDYVAFKYDRYSGDQLWGKSYFGPATGDDGAFRIGLDINQNVYLGGNSWGGSNFDWAAVKFTQTPPAAPTLLSPANNSTNISQTPTFDWSDVSGTLDYQLQVSTNSSFTNNVVNIGTLTASQYIVPAGVLSANTQYYWRVTARSPYGFSPVAGPWSFTTVSGIPAAPTLVSPANGMVGTSLTPLLDWNTVSGASTYSVQVSTNAAFSSTVVNQSGLTASQYTVPGGMLQNNVLYYWRVNAVNPAGTSAWSSVWTFKPVTTGFLQSTSEVPTEYKLFENYPNPFNPSTIIRFALPENNDVILEVYNSLGKKVAALVNQRLAAGVYTLEWDASANTSGIYFFRIQTGQFTATKKMLLLK